MGRAHAELADIGRSLLKVQEEERRRIARDLHDHLAQRLALLEIGLEHLTQGLSGDLDLLRTEIAALQEQTAALGEDVRNISHRLHPAVIEHLGLVKALKDLCDHYQRSRTAPVVFEAVEESCAVPVETATAFYRICEEALRNIQKHAGDASVLVQLRMHSTDRRRVRDCLLCRRTERKARE